ncbi:thioesterase [Streptomyces rectiverticillatus]|uniref:thioesterase II family protein n=1 Tax=Streptomyces rectiverticillatus TaxID=173860 RepID=UPI0015C3B697|nr:thioesterase domain-containing protein [Streptomyces rectiverticillatus]QLE75763.1 thioesterase [Streptomyces rectiverticillatus]
MNSPPAEDDGLWIRRFHPRPDSRVRLVCLPHAGGSAGFYLPLSRAMPDTVEVLCVQYPGRQDRRTEPLVDSVPVLADKVFAALLPWTGLPLALFGHGMGASLAFEIARRLEQQRDTVPAALFVSGRRAPSAHRSEPVHLRDDDTGTRRPGDEDVLRMILPAVRAADYRAAETYAWEPGPPLRTPVTCLIGDDDPQVTLEEAATWSGHTDGAFALKAFPGGHFFLVQHSREIARLMAEQLGTPVRA